jgi:hypothetical protein
MNEVPDRPSPYARLLALLGDSLLAQVGRPRRLASWPARLISRRRLRRRAVTRPGPDGVTLAYGGRAPRHAAAWTHGNWIIVPGPDPLPRALLNHEYVHVLQYRAEGSLRFYWRYLGHLLAAWRTHRDIWLVSPYERQADAIQVLYDAHPELPDLWDLGVAHEPPAPR